MAIANYGRHACVSTFDSYGKVSTPAQVYTSPLDGTSTVLDPNEGAFYQELHLQLCGRLLLTRDSLPPSLSNIHGITFVPSFSGTSRLCYVWLSTTSNHVPLTLPSTSPRIRDFHSLAISDPATLHVHCYRYHVQQQRSR